MIKLGEYQNKIVTTGSVATSKEVHIPFVFCGCELYPVMVGASCNTLSVIPLKLCDKTYPSKKYISSLMEVRRRISEEDNKVYGYGSVLEAQDHSSTKVSRDYSGSLDSVLLENASVIDLSRPVVFELGNNQDGYYMWPGIAYAIIGGNVYLKFELPQAPAHGSVVRNA